MPDSGRRKYDAKSTIAKFFQNEGSQTVKRAFKTLLLCKETLRTPEQKNKREIRIYEREQELSSQSPELARSEALIVRELQ